MSCVREAFSSSEEGCGCGYGGCPPFPSSLIEDGRVDVETKCQTTACESGADEPLADSEFVASRRIRRCKC